MRDNYAVLEKHGLIGRLSIEKRKRVPVYLNEQEHTELKKFCAQLNISMSLFINLSIRDRIKKELEKVKERKLREGSSGG